MSGETEQAVSGWTVDTMRAQLLQQVGQVAETFGMRAQLLQEELDRRFRSYDRFIAADKELLTTRINDQRVAMDERYATQTKALDAALVAQQTAMKTAFDAADKAVVAALESAEKAVTKAEVAAEKRFEAVNEFRAQQADLIAQFSTRKEVDAQLQALSDKSETATARDREDISALQLQVQALNSLGLGREKTEDESRQDDTFEQAEAYNATYKARSQISLIIAAVSGLIAVLALAAAFLH